MQQERLADELMVPVSGQVQPESIEERIALYERRIAMEEADIPYTIVKERFLNWRLKRALLKVRSHVIPTHVLPYSTLKKAYTRGRVERRTGAVAHLGRDEVKFVSLETYNRLGGYRYPDVRALMFDPPAFEEEIALRHGLIPSPYDLSTLLVVEAVPENKIELWLDATTYEDVRERLIEGD